MNATMNVFAGIESESFVRITATMEPQEFNDAGWPGDGSGEDDFADYNANEADDYRNEGNDDGYQDE